MKTNLFETVDVIRLGTRQAFKEEDLCRLDLETMPSRELDRVALKAFERAHTILRWMDKRPKAVEYILTQAKKKNARRLRRYYRRHQMDRNEL